MNNIFTDCLLLMLIAFIVLNFFSLRLVRKVIATANEAIDTAKKLLKICDDWEDIAKRQSAVIEQQQKLLEHDTGTSR